MKILADIFVKFKLFCKKYGKIFSTGSRGKCAAEGREDNAASGMDLANAAGGLPRVFGGDRPPEPGICLRKEAGDHDRRGQFAAPCVGIPAKSSKNGGHTAGLCRDHTLALGPLLWHVRRWAWTPEAMAARLESGEEIPFCDEKIRLEYPNLSEIRVKRSDLAIAGEKVLDLGGLHCHLIPMDTPHSRDGMLALVPEEGILFGGDADGEDFYDGGGTYDKRRLERFIAWLEETDFTWYIPGHWYACTKAEELDMLKQRYAAL